MIDLHSHLIHGIDDGARDLAMSLELARQAADDGTTIIACTPHITPGVYDNTSDIITARFLQLQQAVEAAGIPLRLVMGADVHVSPDLLAKLDAGEIPVLAGTRYFLFEPPHHVLPPGLRKLANQLLDRGYIPILTHPERLSWIEKHYDLIGALSHMGCVIQLTAASITGRFGERPQYWSQRMLDEGLVDIIASDAHHPQRRPAGLTAARDAVMERLGEAAAMEMVWERPAKILNNELLKLPGAEPQKRNKPASAKNTWNKFTHWLSQ